MRKRPSTTAADMRQVGPCCATFRGHFTSKSGEFRKSLRRCVAEIMGNNVKYVYIYIYIYVDNMGYCHPFIQPSIHNRNPNISKHHGSMNPYENLIDDHPKDWHIWPWVNCRAPTNPLGHSKTSFFIGKS